MVKYSIIIPVHNGKLYLQNCVDSIITQQYEDYEIIISDNFSEDGTTEYIDSIQNNHIKVFHTTSFLPQYENWNFAISKAAGRWQMILGSDDSVTPFFFEIADKLVLIAEKKNIKIIKSNRIYFFWSGVEDDYKDLLCSFNIENTFSILKTKEILHESLYNNQFCELPQMYTTCLFRKDLCDRLKDNQLTKHVLYESPDAYLGVAACIMEKKYIYSNMPLGWVGTSVSSQGRIDGLMRNKPDLSKKEMLELSAKTYQTVNSTKLLTAGALICMSNYFDIKTNVLKYKKLFCAVNKDLANKEVELNYFRKLLSTFNITEKSLEKKKFFLKRKSFCFLNIFNKIVRKLISRYKKILNVQSFSFEKKKSICNELSLSDVNALLISNLKINEIVHLKIHHF